MEISPLKQLLIEKSLLSADDAMAYGEQTEKEFLQQLVLDQRVTNEQIAQALADYYAVEYIDLRNKSINATLFDVLPVTLAHRYQCLPLEKEGDRLTIAVSEHFSFGVEELLERSTGLRIELKLASSSAIKDAFEASGTASQLLANLSDEFSSVGEEVLNSRQHIAVDRLSDEQSTIGKLINNLILDAIQKRASDIHIEAQDQTLVSKYRIDGVLQSAAKPIHIKHHATMVSRLKVMAELDIAEKRVPQDGKFRLTVDGRDVDFRVSIMPGAFGEDVVIRILDKGVVSQDVKLSLNDLGFNEETTLHLRKAISEPYGMVLITGPTGSGKTTTLYAALSEVNDGTQKIITIEDPVEYHLDGVVQIPVNEKKQLTFSRGLRSILRHDPDKIMVGEIRDLETADIAIQSSLTGHLVFSTVHANNAFDVIGRFTHMGVDVYNFVSALNCVVAQRLVRKICPSCKRPHEVDDEYLRYSAIDQEKQASASWHQGEGCDACHGTGYRGRVAITEYLKLTPEIREMIVDRQPSSTLYRKAAQDGLVTLREAGIKLAAKGETTLMEVNRVTFID